MCHARISDRSVRLDSVMNDFGVLTNRKRAVIALIHSIVFLVGISRGLVERAYFALCATSATSGLLRTIFGDRVVPPAQYLRVLMLSSAVGIGLLILRSHSRSAVCNETALLPSDASPD